MALGQLNVGYRPLTPADDVAGLAGQKQAVDEFNSLSQDEARKAATLQAQAELMVKSQIENAKRINQSRQISVQSMNAMTSAASQRARAAAASQELMLQQQLMPGKIEAMALANESQAIDNAYAAEHQRAAIDGMYAQNEAQAIANQYAAESERAAIDGMYARNEGQIIANNWAGIERETAIEGQRLINEVNQQKSESFKIEMSELSTLVAYEQGLRDYVDNGGDPENYRYPGGACTTKRCMDARASVMSDIKDEAATRLIDARTDTLNSKVIKLDRGQQSVLRNTQASPALPGLKKYMTPDGNDYLDTGEALIRRFEEQNKLLKPGEKEEMIDRVGFGPQKEHPWAKLIDGGTLMMTDEGLQELRNRRAEERAKDEPVSRVVTTEIDPKTGRPVEKTTTTYKPVHPQLQKLIDEGVEHWRKNDLGGGTPPPEMMRKIKRSAKIQAGKNVAGMTVAERRIAEKDGYDLYYVEDGQAKFFGEGGSTTTAAGGGVGTATDTATGTATDTATGTATDTATGTATGSTAYLSAGPVVAANVERANAETLSDTDGKGRPMIANNAATRTLTENIPHHPNTTGYAKEVWDKSAFPHLGTFRKQMVMSPAKHEPNDKMGITNGYGMPDVHADIVVSYMKRRQTAKSMTTTGGSNIVDQVNGAIDYYSEVNVKPHRKNVGKLLGWDKKFPITDKQGRKATSREFHELISTEVVDAKVTRRDGKAISMEELLATPLSDWVGKTITWPMAKELWGDGPTPNAPTKGSIHDPNRERFYFPTTLDPAVHDFAALKSTLEALIKESAVLKELGPYIRVSQRVVFPWQGSPELTRITNRGYKEKQLTIEQKEAALRAIRKFEPMVPKK